jgi:tetratricopeptide (TPR) repeat protein
LGKLLRRRGRLDEAESLLARALAMRQRLYAFDSPETADACAELGRVIAARGDPSTAIERQRESLRIRRAIHAGDHDEVQASLTDLGLALRGAGRGAEARPVLEEAFLMRRRLSPEDDPEVTEARLNLAFLLSEDLGDPASAEVLLRAALASETRRRAVGDPELAEYHRHVGDACRAQEHVADAEREYVAALELRRAQSPRGSAACAQSLCDVAWARARRGDVAKAEAWSREAFTMACAHLPEAEGAVLESARRLVTILRSRDELADAEAIVLAAYGALARANGGSDDARRAAARDARDFYEALDAARPRQGFAEKAAAWRELATRPLEAGPTPTPR